MACEKHWRGTHAYMYKCQWAKEETGTELEDETIVSLAAKFAHYFNI